MWRSRRTPVGVSKAPSEIDVQSRSSGSQNSHDPQVSQEPRRTFADIPEPRRAVLDEVAARSLSVPIVIEPAAT